jgi:hypothetical protein
MNDTLTIFNSLQDTLLIKQVVTSSSSVDISQILDILTGIVGVLLGFILSKLTDIFDKRYKALTDFKFKLSEYADNKITYKELNVYYSMLRKKQRKTVNLNLLQDPNKIEKEVINILSKI